MSAAQCLLLVAFLAPVPPIRPEPPRTPPGWLPGFFMAALVFILVAPMVAIWGFHRPEAKARIQCTASGGRLVYASGAVDGPLRCSNP